MEIVRELFSGNRAGLAESSSILPPDYPRIADVMLNLAKIGAVGYAPDDEWIDSALARGYVFSQFGGIHEEQPVLLLRLAGENCLGQAAIGRRCGLSASLPTLLFDFLHRIRAARHYLDKLILVSYSNGWRMSDVADFGQYSDMRSGFIECERSSNGQLNIQPRAIGSYQSSFSNVSTLLSGIGRIPVSAIHLDRVERIDKEKHDPDDFHERLSFIPPILFLLASNVAMIWGFLTIRLNRCRNVRHFWLCCTGLFGGFACSVLSGLILTNRLGI